MLWCLCFVSQLLTKHQRNQSGKTPKGQASKIVLSKEQASQILYFQMIRSHTVHHVLIQSNLLILEMLLQCRNLIILICCIVECIIFLPFNLSSWSVYSACIFLVATQALMKILLNIRLKLCNFFFDYTLCKCSYCFIFHVLCLIKICIHWGPEC
jgi:hypothetical protein